MDSSTAAARFMSRGLDADVDKTVLYPLTPTYDCLGPIGIEANMVSWCLPDTSFPASTLLDKLHCEPSCEPPSDYFFLPRNSFSVLQNPGIGPNWPAPHTFTFEVPFPTVSDAMGSDSGAWTGEAGADKTIQVGVPNGQDSSSSSPMDANSSIHAKRPSSEESLPPATLLSSLTTPMPKSATTRPRSRTGKHNIQLRTASRKSPKASPSSGSPTSPTESANNGSASDPDDELTPEERRARRSHNRVEKQYRNRLNNQFERLLAVLPLDQHRKGTGVHDGNVYSSDEKRMSKAEVLDLATRRIKALEVDRERLQKEREEILRNIDVMAVAVKGAHQKS